MKEEELQQKYAEIQLINQNFQQVQEQISLLSQQLENLIKVNEALDAIKDVKERNPILVPLGGGLFVKAEVDKKNDFVVNVGSETLIKKSWDDAKNIIAKQTEEVSGIIGQLEMNLHELSHRGQRLQEELSECVSELDGKKQ